MLSNSAKFQRDAFLGGTIAKYLMPIQIICRLVVAALVIVVMGCASQTPSGPRSSNPATPEAGYLLGPGDSIQIFVWRNPNLSVSVPIRPDGKFSTPLVEDIVAAGRTPTQLSREIEKRLSTYIKNPIVTIIVNTFVGPASQQIRVIGEVASPQALPYRKGMTLLDVMITVGGLTEFAAGNRAKIVRRVGSRKKEIKVRLQTLLKRGDIKADLQMQPGDILIVPQSFL